MSEKSSYSTKVFWGKSFENVLTETSNLKAMNNAQFKPEKKVRV